MEMVEGLVKTTLEEMERVLGARTVVGEPITVEGATLVPLISIAFGFGAGGGAGKGEARQKGEGSGGGAGGGVLVRPVAMIIADKEGVRIESIKSGITSAIEKLGETVPRIMEETLEKLADKWVKARKEE